MGNAFALPDNPAPPAPPAPQPTAQPAPLPSPAPAALPVPQQSSTIPTAEPAPAALPVPQQSSTIPTAETRGKNCAVQETKEAHGVGGAQSEQLAPSGACSDKSKMTPGIPNSTLLQDCREIVAAYKAKSPSTTACSQPNITEDDISQVLRALEMSKGSCPGVTQVEGGQPQVHQTNPASLSETDSHGSNDVSGDEGRELTADQRLNSRLKEKIQMMEKDNMMEHLCPLKDDLTESLLVKLYKTYQERPSPPRLESMRDSLQDAVEVTSSVPTGYGKVVDNSNVEGTLVVGKAYNWATAKVVVRILSRSLYDHHVEIGAKGRALLFLWFHSKTVARDSIPRDYTMCAQWEELPEQAWVRLEWPTLGIRFAKGQSLTLAVFNIPPKQLRNMEVMNKLIGFWPTIEYEVLQYTTLKLKCINSRDCDAVAEMLDELGCFGTLLICENL